MALLSNISVTDLVLILAQFILGLGVLYSSFCRLVKTHADVAPSVRGSLVFSGIAGLLASMAPLIWGYPPNCISISLLLAVMWGRITSACTWKSGVPQDYFRDSIQAKISSEAQGATES